MERDVVFTKVKVVCSFYMKKYLDSTVTNYFYKYHKTSLQITKTWYNVSCQKEKNLFLALVYSEQFWFSFQDWFKQSILRNILRSRIQAGSAKDSRGKKKTPKKTEYSRGKEKIVWMKGGMLLFERDSSHFFTVPFNGSCIIWSKRRKDSK